MNLNILKKKQATKEVALSLREKKHQANLQKNNGLYFQIGLIATLFIMFGVFQLKFTMNPIEIPKPTVDIGEVIRTAPVDYVIEENIVKKVVKQVKQKPTETYKEVPDHTEIPPEEFLPEVPDSPKNNLLVENVNPDEEEDVIDTVPVSLVSEYPEYPGCDKFSDKKRKFECFQHKIAKHIQRKFDSDIAADNGLSGTQKIYILFTINHEGDIIDIMAKSKHPVLQKEALRAVKSLPKMKPAKQGYKKVNVTYTLPLVFRVD